MNPGWVAGPRLGRLNLHRLRNSAAAYRLERGMEFAAVHPDNFWRCTQPSGWYQHPSKLALIGLAAVKQLFDGNGLQKMRCQYSSIFYILLQGRLGQCALVCAKLCRTPFRKESTTASLFHPRYQVAVQPGFCMVMLHSGPTCGAQSGNLILVNIVFTLRLTP